MFLKCVKKPKKIKTYSNASMETAITKTAMLKKLMRSILMRSLPGVNFSTLN